MPSLVRRTLREYRRAVIGWAVGVAAFVAIYVGYYAQIKNNPTLLKQDSVPKGMRDFIGVADFTSAVGYLEGSVYGLLGPLLLIMFAAILGTRGVAGPEESGVLDLLMSNPIGRRRFVVERFSAFAALVIAVCLVPWVLVLIYDNSLNMGISAANVSAASLGLMLLALCFGTLAFAVGAATGNRSTALAVTGAAAVVSYLIRSLGNISGAIRPLRWISPFHYYLGGNPLQSGFQVGYLLVLVVIVAALAVVGLFTFERRDLGV
jgi:ABC-2 type transport system permease protein